MATRQEDFEVEPMVILEGSPTEIGTQMWTTQCVPIVKAVEGMAGGNKAAMVEFYSGAIMAAMGSLAADVGQEHALAIGRHLMEVFARFNAGESGHLRTLN